MKKEISRPYNNILKWVKGYLVVVGGSEYKILNIKNGDVLYKKTFPFTICGMQSGPTNPGYVTIRSCGRDKTESIPFSPKGFREEYIEEWTDPQLCELGDEKFSSAGRGDTYQENFTLLHFKEFIALIDDSTSDFLWVEDAIIPQKRNNIARNDNKVLYAKENKIVVLDLTSGQEIGTISFPENINSVSDHGGFVYVLPEEGEAFRINDQLKNLEESKDE
jgi:hypothetical protein